MRRLILFAALPVGLTISIITGCDSLEFSRKPYWEDAVWLRPMDQYERNSISQHDCVDLKKDGVRYCGVGPRGAEAQTQTTNFRLNHVWCFHAKSETITRQIFDDCTHGGGRRVSEKFARIVDSNVVELYKQPESPTPAAVASPEKAPSESKEAPSASVPSQPPLSPPKLLGTGTGFVITGAGHVLTNHHVIEDCGEVRIGSDTKVNVVAIDTNVDLALLQGRKRESAAVRFRGGRGIRPGDEVVGAGYPLQGFLTSDLSITTGIISALAGPGNDRRLIQISAPVQPGNSGGPLLDLSGHLVGIIVGKLDAIKVAQATGDIPQNVNFAISALSARAFLDSQAVPYETAPAEVQHSTADVAAMARQFTVRIECWN